MANRGRPPSAKTLVDRQLGRNKKQAVIPTDDFIIPNLSGDHSAGHTKTPTKDTDLVNKKYVDDNSIWSKNGDKIYYNDGYVGIGTNNPTAHLHLYTSSGAIVPYVETEAADRSIFVFKNSNALWMVGAKPNGDYEINCNLSEMVTINKTTGEFNINLGQLNMHDHKIIGVKDPTANQEVATKKYVDDNAGGGLWEVDGTETQLTTADDIDMQTKKIINAVNPTADQDVATKSYVDDKTFSGTVETAIVSANSNTSVISAVAGKKTYVVAVSIHNNDTDAANYTHIKFTDGNGGTNLYGDANGQALIPGQGGFFGLGMSLEAPWFNTSTNTALYVNPTDGKRVAGIIKYYQE